MNNLDSKANAASEYGGQGPLQGVVAVANGEHAGFLTLPREIRDHIYLDLVVTADPIQYDENFTTLSHNDTFAHNAMMWMFETRSNSQIARETCEAFYQHNTFLIYTRDIPTLFRTKSHAMLFEDGGELQIYSTRFEAGLWVRKLAVRVGWHASDSWFPDPCCLEPAEDLRVLLVWDSLQSVIIDARFGAWSYGYPQGIGWNLLAEMKRKWGKHFKIYNDQTTLGDTHRYDGDRRDISSLCDSPARSDHETEEVESTNGDDGQLSFNEDEDESH